MCESKGDKSPNVPATVAGYYYQILLACREITSLTNDEDCVGIEAYADVRIEENKQVFDDDKIIIEKYQTSLEAKFHKSSLRAFDEDITKTIYNFYRYTSKDKEFIFSTNVSITGDSKELLEVNWDKEEFNDRKIQFIQKCILRHSVKHDKEEPFKKYKESKGSKVDIRMLEKDIFEDGNEKYEEYAFINKDVDYLEFAKKIRFQFGNKGKETTIKELREEIARNILTNHPKYYNLIKDGGDDIVNALVYEYFQIVTRNSALEKKNPTFEELEKLSVRNMKKCIEQYKVRIEKFNEIFEKDNILKVLESSESEFISEISNPKRYSGSYKDSIIESFSHLMKKFQKHIRTEHNYRKIINKFSIGSDLSWVAVLDAIKQASIIAALKKCTIDEVAVGLDEREDDTNVYGIDNVFVGGTVKYSYKKYSTSLGKSIEDFIIKFANDLDYSKINDNQIVVTSDLLSDEKPCDSREKIESEDFLSGILFDICETNSETFQKNITYLKKIDYKCTECITFRKDDKKMEKNVDKFIKKRCGD